MGLAPDEEVRGSGFWKEKKEEGKEKQVWRDERTLICAATVKDLREPNIDCLSVH
jgi:hypothetical protein